MLYFLTIFRSCVARATRSRSGEGPTMVPASSRITQSFFAALCEWTGTKWLGTFLLKRPIGGTRSLLRLVKVSQVRRRLVLLGRHQVAIGAQEVGLRADRHMVVSDRADILHEVRVVGAAISLEHGPGARQGVV